MKARVGIHIFLIALLGCAGTSFAQQDPMYSMYMFDKMLINPAFAGSSNWAVGTLKYREQAKSYTGHPVTETFNFHGPIQRKHIGLGFKVVNDDMPVQNTLNASAFFSYHLTFAGGKLSLGLEGGMIRKTIDFDKLILTTDGDQAIPLNAVTSTMPDLSAGLYYQKKQFYFGLSSAHMLSSVTSDPQDPVVGPGQNVYFLMGNVFDLGPDVTLEPSILARYTKGSMPQGDLNLMLYFFDRFGIGGQYRSNEAIVGIVRIEPIRGLRIAYSYDYGYKSTQSFVNGSHEIILSYGIKLAPPPSRKEIHPRYYF